LGPKSKRTTSPHDLFMGIAARAGGKQIGNSINDSEAMFGGRGGDGTDQLIEERSAIRKGAVVSGVH
ncbi:MAG: hypothetical protein WA770_19360, partial [Pseudolabrys sp.]